MVSQEVKGKAGMAQHGEGRQSREGDREKKRR